MHVKHGYIMYMIIICIYNALIRLISDENYIPLVDKKKKQIKEIKNRKCEMHMKCLNLNIASQFYIAAT